MYLGLDLGTSEFKAVLLARDQRIVGQAAAPITTSRPLPLWSEQAPGDWESALLAVTDELCARFSYEMSEVQAIGIAGQMHGAVLLDADDKVLRPAILWNDGRSEAECLVLDAECPEARSITGNLAMPGLTAPKLLWVRRHEPDIFDAVRTILLPKDYLRLVLTGEKLTDCSDASGTFWFDVAERRWSPVLLAACGLDETHMPRVVEGNAPGGRLRSGWARRWGMRDGVVVAGGAGDNAASAIGLGIIAPGQGIVSLGTSGVIFLVSDGFCPDPPAAIHAFCHALPQTWHQMSVMLSAASCLRWVTRLTARPNETALLAEMESLTAQDRAVAPLFLPYLSGERTPHNDSGATAGFIGLDHGHSAAALAYAVIEGVAFGLRDGLSALLGAGGTVRELSLVGGGTRSAAWCQLLANVLEMPLLLVANGETAGAVGAARLGWLADGGDLAQVCGPAPVTRRLVPDPDAGRHLHSRYQRFRAAYPALRGLS